MAIGIISVIIISVSITISGDTESSFESNEFIGNRESIEQCESRREEERQEEEIKEFKIRNKYAY